MTPIAFLEVDLLGEKKEVKEEKREGDLDCFPLRDRRD